MCCWPTAGESETLYYNNTLDGQGEINVDTLAASKPTTDAQAIHVMETEPCESCTI